MMDLALETATTGAQNCAEMFAEIKVYEIIDNKEDRFVDDLILDDEKLKAYSIDSPADVKKQFLDVVLPEDGGCYIA